MSDETFGTKFPVNDAKSSEIITILSILNRDSEELLTHLIVNLGGKRTNRKKCYSKTKKLRNTAFKVPASIIAVAITEL